MHLKIKECIFTQLHIAGEIPGHWSNNYRLMETGSKDTSSFVKIQSNYIRNYCLYQRKSEIDYHVLKSMSARTNSYITAMIWFTHGMSLNVRKGNIIWLYRGLLNVNSWLVIDIISYVIVEELIISYITKNINIRKSWQ